MLGIALGGVATGVDRGLGLRDRLDKQRERRADQRFGQDLKTEARQAFDASGKPADQWDQFFTRFAAPRHAARLIEQGDLAGAEQWQTWLENDNVKRATRLFGEGMLAGQHGDMETAMQRWVEAANIQGYGADINIVDVSPTDAGGWRIRGTGPGGEFDQEFTNQDELLNFAATYLNPQAAFEQWQQSRAASGEFQRDVAKAGATERERLGARLDDDLVRRDLGLERRGRGGGGERDLSPSDRRQFRKDAREELEREGVDLDQMTDSERERAINERIDRMLGRESAPAADQPMVRFNPQTGEIIEGDAPQPPAASPRDEVRRERPEATGIAAPESREPAHPSGAPQARGLDWTRPRSIEEWEADEAATGTPIPDAIGRGAEAVGEGVARWRGEQGRRQDATTAAIAQVIDRARQMLARGTDPRIVAEALRRQGIPEEHWPPELRG